MAYLIDTDVRAFVTAPRRGGAAIPVARLFRAPGAETSGVSAVDGLASRILCNGEYAFEDDVLVLIFNFARVDSHFRILQIPG